MLTLQYPARAPHAVLVCMYQGSSQSSKEGRENLFFRQILFYVITGMCKTTSMSLANTVVLCMYVCACVCVCICKLVRMYIAIDEVH